MVATLGGGYRNAAVDSFLHGFQLTVAIAAACTALAAGLAYAGFRQSAARLAQVAPRGEPASASAGDGER